MTAEPPSSEDRLRSWLQAHGHVQGNRSRWGRVIPTEPHPTGVPQPLMDASALQRRFVACAHATPAPGPDLCASWVEQAFSRLGFGVVLGDAAHLYDSYCHHIRLNELKVGMIVAVSRHPFAPQGRIHGHVGLYAGDDTILDAVEDQIRTTPLSLWLTAYGLMSEPRWGWLGSMDLSL